ncbi:MAG: diheme cytochrome c [Gallionellaceae bacterium]|jgi:phage-related protein
MSVFNRYNNFLISFMAIVSLSCATFSLAHASEGESRSTPKNTKWQAECGSCHVAFPPRLLSAASWRAMMSSLNKHFGTDASLDAKSAAEIAAFLEKNAGSRKTESASGTPLLRITETRWFIHEHDEVNASVWKNPKVKSAVNCAACHTQAESGNYSEHNIRIPQ